MFTVCEKEEEKEYLATAQSRNEGKVELEGKK